MSLNARADELLHVQPTHVRILIFTDHKKVDEILRSHKPQVAPVQRYTDTIVSPRLLLHLPPIVFPFG